MITGKLSERQWQIAHAIAQQLVRDKADVNELKKVMAYLRTIRDQPDAIERFFKYLNTLTTQGNRIGHSQRTQGYYASMESVCKQYLQGEVSNTTVVLGIIGWSFRLMRYYKKGIPPETLNHIAAKTEVREVRTERQAEIAELVAAENFSVGQELDAKITKIKGNRVTYEMLGTISLSHKEPKKFKLLSEGQAVRVAISELREDGSIKKVKLLE